MELVVSEKSNIIVSQYKFMFNLILSKYNEYCIEWDKLYSQRINLKKKCICDIYNIKKSEFTLEFIKYINSFKEIAEDIEFDLICEFGQNIQTTENFKFISRIKTTESLIQKVLKKMKEDEGKFSINKCINDLLGLRIIDGDYKENKKYIDNIIEELKKAGFKIKNIERDLVTGYKAYHIYIIRNNYTFPIEIQIWDKEHEQKNIDLHSKHKEDYVKDMIQDYHKY